MEDGALSCVDCVGGWTLLCHLILQGIFLVRFKDIDKKCSLCVNWEACVVRFGLWC